MGKQQTITIHEIDRHQKNAKNAKKKFGGFVFLLYLCSEKKNI